MMWITEKRKKREPKNVPLKRSLTASQSYPYPIISGIKNQDFEH